MNLLLDFHPIPTSSMDPGQIKLDKNQLKNIEQIIKKSNQKEQN